MISQEDIDAFMPETGDPVLDTVHKIQADQHNLQKSIDVLVLMINNMQRDIIGIGRDVADLFSHIEDTR